MTVLNHLNSSESTWKPRAIEGPSLTVPKKSMSPQDMIRRYMRGQSISSSGKEAEYEDQGEGIRLESLDLSERFDILRGLNSRILAQRKADAEKAEAETYAELRAKVLAEYEASKADEPNPTE